MPKSMFATYSSARLAAPIANSSEEFSAFIKAEHAKRAQVIKASGARVD